MGNLGNMEKLASMGFCPTGHQGAALHHGQHCWGGGFMSIGVWSNLQTLEEPRQTLSSEMSVPMASEPTVTLHFLRFCYPGHSLSPCAYLTVHPIQDLALGLSVQASHV